MTRFDEFLGSEKESQPPMEIDMTLTCQKCNASVDKGKYYPDKEFLMWACHECHHVSHIEKFALF
jgi:hypothetical protein